MPIFEVASLIGTIAFAISGFLLGVRKELDLMGLFIVAMLTATGGGVLRDVLVGRTPNVLQNDVDFLVVSVVILIAIVLKVQRFHRLERRLFFVISDSIGLVAFSITGALVALESDVNLFGTLLLALLTATGGGIIRDILLNEVPTVLESGFYGSVAVLVALVFFIMDQLALSLDFLVVTGVFSLALVIRLLAHFNDWHLPKIKKDESLA